MECKNTSTSSGSRSAFTLIELMVASTLALVLGTAIAMFAWFSNRSFVTMSHYVEMNLSSQLALDKMSKEIRQARRLTAYATNSLTFQDASSNSLQFTYSPITRQLVRISGGKTTTYLSDCDALQFWIYQHTVKSNTFECYDAAAITNARVIQVTWNCSRKILGKQATTENVQSAQIAIRNR